MIVGNCYKLRKLESFSKEEIEYLDKCNLPTWEHYTNWGKEIIVVAINKPNDNEMFIPIEASDGFHYPLFVFESTIHKKLDKILEGK